MAHTATERATRAAALATALAAAVMVAACSPDDILDVEDIDVAFPDVVADSTALPNVLAGAIGEFGFAYNGNASLNVVTLSGLLADELLNTETFPTRIEIDQRRQQHTNGTLRDLFYDIQQARAMADRTEEAYGRFLPTSNGRAEALNLSALTYIFMAENYCGAVPVSRQVGPSDFEYGEMLTTAQLLDSAIAKAGRAGTIAQTVAADATVSAATRAAATSQLRFSRVIRARAMLNLDQPAAAATEIGGEAGVPSTFQYFYKHAETTGRQNNGTWALTVSVARFGVPDREGTNGLPFRSEGLLTNANRDVRIPNVRRPGRGLGFDNTTQQWMQQKYSKRDTLAIVADGVEARLIEAEAQWRAGDVSGAFLTLNNLRNNGAVKRLRGYLDPDLQPLAMPQLTPAATPEAQLDQIFKERAYWLYLTGHRLGDVRRLIRPTTAPPGGISGYGRATESVFPTGAYHKSGTYGTDVNTPVPQAEENNPNFQRSACVVTQP
jgi:hypothetical protein